jgi:glycosyltransferase involved in cell wall biosynthesis
LFIEDSSLIEKYGSSAPELFARLTEVSEVGGHAGVNRYLYDIYRRRPDLQKGYPDIDGDGAHQLVDWAYRFGREEVPIPPELMPSAWLGGPAPVGAGAGINRYLHLLHARSPWLQEAFPDLSGPDAERFMEWARSVGVADDPVLRDLLSESTSRNGERRRLSRPTTGGGVNVVGFLRGELGLGEAARRVIAALDAASVPLIPVGQPLKSNRAAHGYPTLDLELASFDTNLVCLNADQHVRLYHDSDPAWTRDRYTIGFWWWEVEGALPVEWLGGFALVDEIWAGSDHVRDTLAAFSPVPVTKVKVPVEPSPVPAWSRRQLGLPEGFLFLTMFDYDSTVQRKNPLGTIEAFKAAFGPDEGAVLAVKSINGDRHPDKRARLEEAAAGRADIHLIDRYATAAEKNAMLAACDCYVSLHRAEGFGLPLAEAMYMGTPVIATGYSGNLEFMSEHNSYLVAHGMTNVGIEAEPYYPADGMWAEPDLDDAARAMREVAGHQAEAARRGRAAAEHMRREFSAEAAGVAMRARLEAIWPRSSRSQEPPAEGSTRLLGLVDEVDRAAGAGVGVSSPGRARERARRAALRLMRPFTFHQRRLNRELAERVDELHRGAYAQALGRLEREAALTRAQLLGEIRSRDARIAEISARLEQLDQG